MAKFTFSQVVPVGMLGEAWGSCHLTADVLGEGP